MTMMLRNGCLAKLKSRYNTMYLHNVVVPNGDPMKFELPEKISRRDSETDVVVIVVRHGRINPNEVEVIYNGRLWATFERRLEEVKSVDTL